MLENSSFTHFKAATFLSAAQQGVTTQTTVALYKNEQSNIWVLLTSQNNVDGTPFSQLLPQSAKKAE